MWFLSGKSKAKQHEISVLGDVFHNAWEVVEHCCTEYSSVVS